MAVLVDRESAPHPPGPVGRAPLPLGGYLPPATRPASPRRAEPEAPGPRRLTDPRPRRLPRNRHRPAGLASAAHARPSVASSCERTYARRRFVALLVIGLVATAAVVGLALLRAAAVDDGVPSRTAVVEVRSGETLWELAQRVAPQSPPQAVVERIRELNDMRGSTVHPGQPLVVPAGS